MIKNLPPLHPSELAHSQTLKTFILKQIHDKGAMRFDHYMQLALYHPTLGYYTSSRRKLSGTPSDNAQSLQGDFVTAPELSPWFGRTLALSVQQVLAQCSQQAVLEFGAGSGKLARDLLQSFNNPNLNYFILEVSPDLRDLQQETLKDFTDQVVWLDALPTSFTGCMVANEVLDAMPVRLVGYDSALHAVEYFVQAQGDEWVLEAQPLTERPAGFDQIPTLPDYQTELNEPAMAWTKSLAQCLQQGAIFLIDYGFPASEYYHPQRNQGTLMCHLHHHAHDQVLAYPGIQDITAHVDFSAIAQTAYESGLEVLGYTSQANFLINSGLLQLLSSLDPNDVMHYAQQIGPVQKLISEAEMGELFKVLMLGKGLDLDPIGFSHADRRDQL